jgi:hypothetical protein
LVLQVLLRCGAKQGQSTSPISSKLSEAAQKASTPQKQQTLNQLLLLALKSWRAQALLLLLLLIPRHLHH